MTPERWKEAEGYIYAAWELPEGARAAFVREKCGHNEELLSEVLTLVEARRAADEWQAPQEEARGERRFGAYRLQKMIGRGGMGAVYLADRADGEFDQRVAIKVVGLPFEIGPLRERFRLERQILADLNHPNISHLIDGGVTEDGELYLAMEYIDGVPLDEHIRGRKLTEAQRLGLFRQIAGAVAYAHQHLVVHRDLKPSNILVTADGVVKLLDFGTAKLLSEQERAQRTVTGDAFLTVAYASPEQLRGKSATTLSDVFALGAILHELVTGEKAFAEGLEARFGETAGARRVLVGDLGLIVGKALEVEPERRYGSVLEMLADVEAYSQGRPVKARAATWGYRAAKFVQRNRWAVGASALLIVAAVVGAGMTLWQARKALGRDDEAKAAAGDGLTELRALASVEKASLTHVFGACRWLAETEVVSLRDGVGAAAFCRNSVQMTGGRELDAFAGLAKALAVMGDGAGAIREMEKAIALLPPVREGEPVSRQRSDMEAELRRLRGARAGRQQ